ncbi:MAG: DNA polymerase III subunit beta [Lachnospiraceae bacterium]|nr:DNA polymerase III subunit beta [Lachnospiraceae bacterium]
MKIVSDVKEFQRAISVCSRAINSKSTLNMHDCVLIDARNGRISMTASDSDFVIETEIEGTIEESGRIVLEADYLDKVIKSLSSEKDEKGVTDVRIETKENYRTIITSGSAKNTTLPGRDGAEFSVLPAIDRTDSLTISEFSLRQIINQTIFSINSNESNVLMSSECFEIDGNVLKVASLDGKRISIRKIVLRDAYGNRKLIIPGKVLNEISRILHDDTEKDVVISISENRIVFDFEKTTVVSQLVDGTYFDVDQMIVTDYETKILVKREALIAGLERARIFVRDGDSKPVILTVKDGTMNIRVTSAVGSTDDNIDIEKSGKDIVIGFNAKFLIEALRAVDDETVSIDFVNSKAPCYLRNDDDTYVYMVLPINFVNVD